jgi:DNA-binding CsgD family transcriptional regulator
MYCCFILLGLNNQEITLILDVQLSSLYKLKQRLAQKFNLDSSSDIIHFLKKLWLD